jgi:hypothetical protein
VSQQSARSGILVSTIAVDDNAEATLDPVVLLSNGKFQSPFPESDETAQNRFAKKYFGPGQKYRVTFGGGEAGSVTIKGSQIGCNSLHATGEAQVNTKIRGRIMGLATNSDNAGRRDIARRAPTESERATAMELVKGIYLSRETPPSWLKLLTTTNLTATDLDYDGKFELVGSFVIQTPGKARRDLLLIAEPQRDKFKPALVAFQSYKLPPEEFDSAVDFVDQLDLDGDGIGEVFVIEHGFDAYGYSIYKKRNGRWRKVYSAIGDAC